MWIGCLWIGKGVTVGEQGFWRGLEDSTKELVALPGMMFLEGAAGTVWDWCLWMGLGVTVGKQGSGGR